MKLKTKLIGHDRNGVVTITVESDNKGAGQIRGCRRDQELRHDLAVNNAHAALRCRFSVLEIDVKS